VEEAHPRALGRHFVLAVGIEPAKSNFGDRTEHKHPPIRSNNFWHEVVSKAIRSFFVFYVNDIFVLEKYKKMQ
jgi:hypothetical protein